MTNLDALFLTRYGPKGASSRYRFLQNFPRLKAAGIHCTYEPLLGDRYLEELYGENRQNRWLVVTGYLRRVCDLLRVREYDIVVVEKELLPYVPAIFERILGNLGTPYVVDYDDAVFHNYDTSENPVVRRLLGRKIDVVIREADAVIAGNDYLASRAHEAGASRVEIIPTAIDMDRYPHVPPEGGDFTIGWIGSPDTIEYVHPIVDALRSTCDEIDATVSLIGSGPVEFDDVPIDVIEWSENSEIESLSQLDVGIMPLRDGPWERGKCGLKLIQYMGCGKPVVASPVGANTSIVEDGTTGFFASTLDEWVDRLVQLANDIDLSRQLGANGRRRVEENYCLSVTVPKMVDVIECVSR